MKQQNMPAKSRGAFGKDLNDKALETIKENGGIVNEVDKDSLIAACADAKMQQLRRSV